jgi:NhaP-type Na+/H+ or K+/H+ antiporter
MIWKSTLLLIATSLASAAEDEHLDEEAPEPANAVLFPAWSLTLGVVAFYVLSRYARALPYTAVMFLLGTLMGITVELGDFHDHIGDSIRLWTGINSEVLLLVFLPGLLFRDAMSQNVHLFVYAINQIMIFAFPMVLAGTVLTALVAFYIFPYDWPFNLAMAFGSILSATDPVAVAALLEEVGAPPRLKVHIAGESLVNDGAAIVFFSIFYQKYLFEDLADIGGQEHGENIDVAKGFAMFFQKAVGGFAVGLMFGIVQLIILFLLDRRVSREENIVQVTSVIGMAYLNFYTADFVWQTSGVISTVTAGLIVKLFGRAGINGTLQVSLDS